MTDEQYQQGLAQFAQMVGADKIDALQARFRSVSPEFERAVMGIIGGQIWTRPNLDLRTRSLVSVGVLAALGRVNALNLHRNGPQQWCHARRTGRDLLSSGHLRRFCRRLGRPREDATGARRPRPGQ